MLIVILKPRNKDSCISYIHKKDDQLSLRSRTDVSNYESNTVQLQTSSFHTETNYKSYGCTVIILNSIIVKWCSSTACLNGCFHLTKIFKRDTGDCRLLIDIVCNKHNTARFVCRTMIKGKRRPKNMVWRSSS